MIDDRWATARLLIEFEPLLSSSHLTDNERAWAEEAVRLLAANEIGLVWLAELARLVVKDSLLVHRAKHPLTAYTGP